MHTKITKEDKIIESLKTGPKTVLELILKTKIVDVRKRISDIRKKSEETGVFIFDDWQVNEKTGTRFKVYFVKFKKIKRK